MDKVEKTEFRISNGEVRVWLEQGQSVCIKAITSAGDPVELSSEEAEELAAALRDIARLAK